MAFADWIMRAATNQPPQGREPWAQAMQAEYASLADGKLSWALGCWSTMLGWRLRAEALYLVVLITTLSVWAFFPLFAQTAYFWSLVYCDKLLHSDWMVTIYSVMFLVSMGLSAFRPDRVIVTGLTMFAFDNASAIAMFYYLKRLFPDARMTDPFSSHWQHYNTSYFNSELAVAGICIVGALTGRWIGVMLRKRVLPTGEKPSRSN